MGRSICTILGSDQFYGWDMIGLRSMSEGPDAGPMKGIIQGTIPKLSLPSHGGYELLQLYNRI